MKINYRLRSFLWSGLLTFASKFFDLLLRGAGRFGVDTPSRPAHFINKELAPFGGATSLIIASSALLSSSLIHAADGTWNVDANGLWSLDTNWASSIIANDLTSTANFTNNITGDRTVSLDTDRTINRVNFSVSTIATAVSWILNNNAVATNNLILSGTTGVATGTVPVIDVGALGAGKTATISAIIEGSYGFTKTGTGQLTLSGVNTYSGTTTVSSGTLLLNNANAINNSAVSVASGATLQMANNLTYLNTNPVTIAGEGTGPSGQNGALRFGNSTVWAAPITLNGNSTIFSYGGVLNTTLNGATTGTGNLRLASQGGASTHKAVWTLNAASSYSGSTAIVNTDGLADITVKLGVDNALPTATSLNLTGATGQATVGGVYTTLDLNGFSQTLAGLTDTGASQSKAQGFGKRVINSSGTLSTLTLNIASGTNTYGTTGTNVLAGTIGGTTAAGVAANNLALTKTGTGTLVLGGTNTYTGTTTVSSGTLLVNTGASIAASASIVNGGLLRVNGTAGSVTVNSGATLGGSGSVGALSLNSGGLLNPGNSPGTLTAASAIVLGGSTYNWQIAALQGTAGTNWDLLSVTTLLDMSRLTSENKWNLVVTADGAFTGWTGTDSYSYVFAQAANLSLSSGVSTAVGTDVTSLFNITALNITSLPNATHNSNGDFKVVVGSANGLATLNLIAIPEPSTGSVLIFGLASLMTIRAMRKKKHL